MEGPFILEIDGGNSGYKWRLLGGAGIISSGRFSENELLPGFEAVVGELEEPMQARIVSVAGEQGDAALIITLQALGIEPIHFAEVTREKAGVRCGYEDLNQLGVDRWLAVLAAASEFNGPLAVADFGTALTLDFVDSNRNHLGGYIVPGWGLMCQALIEGTAIDASRVPFDYKAGELGPGLSSSSAIGEGRMLCLSAFVSAGVSRFEKSLGDEVTVTLVCTGGDASRVLPFITKEAVFRPDLVMDGLVLALS